MKNVDIADPMVDPEWLFMDFRTWMNNKYPPNWKADTALVYIWASSVSPDIENITYNHVYWQQVRNLCELWLEIGLLRPSQDYHQSYEISQE